MVAAVALLLVAIAVVLLVRRKPSAGEATYLSAPRESSNSMERVTVDADGTVTISTNEEHGLVGDKHYTDCVGDVQRLKREAKYDEAIALLVRTIDATENEARVAGAGWGVAPWYYEQLAIIYRKLGRVDDEVGVLMRYARQQKAPGAGPQKLALRLDKAKEIQKRKSA